MYITNRCSAHRSLLLTHLEPNMVVDLEKQIGSIPQEVKEAKGTKAIRDAIHAIQFQNGVKRFESTQAGAKLQKVDIQINVEGVTIVDYKTKMALHRYPLQKISFCADDKQDKRIF
ncbi:hypothetical protein TELCIR_20337, partial [Teladorsagia circumcincta]